MLLWHTSTEIMNKPEHAEKVKVILTSNEGIYVEWHGANQGTTRCPNGKRLIKDNEGDTICNLGVIRE